MQQLRRPSRMPLERYGAWMLVREHERDGREEQKDPVSFDMGLSSTFQRFFALLTLVVTYLLSHPVRSFSPERPGMREHASASQASMATLDIRHERTDRGHGNPSGLSRWQRLLISVLKGGPVPRHIAFIMDGHSSQCVAVHPSQRESRRQHILHEKLYKNVPGSIV